MASPVVEEVVETAVSTAGTSHVINNPTATAGQLLLYVLGKGTGTFSVNAHASLTELLDEAQSAGFYIAYRWMDGTEPATYTLTTSGATRSATLAYRISGAINPATQAPQIGTTSSGTSATPDPPASATPGSSKDYLFIATYSAAGEEADDDTWSDTPPTNYTPSPPRQKACGTAGTNLGGLIAAAERALTTGVAENPGTFAKDVSAAWRAQTIMIHPALAAPVWEQLAFRFRNDDGSESTATWEAAENTDVTYDATDLDVNKRLRFVLQETSGDAGGVLADRQFKLQCRINGGSYQDVDSSPSVFVKATDSANITHGEITGDQMTAGTGTLIDGWMSENGSGTSGTLTNDGHTQVEFVYQVISTDVAHNDVIDFRVVYFAGGLLTTYTQTPTITVDLGGAAPAEDPYPYLGGGYYPVQG